MAKIRKTFFDPAALGTKFHAESQNVLMTGSMVNWDTVKMKDVQQYGMEINDSYYKEKLEERVKAKKVRDMMR